MEGVCTESHTTFPHPKIKPTVEIPPRKLLFSTAKTIAAAVSPTTHKHGGYNRNTKMVSEEDHNKESEYCYDSDTDDPYATDHFRMFEFKIRRCTRSRSHDWTDCPFAHPGEKARRRDPRRYHYSGDVCPEFRRGGGCIRGDDCQFAHGVFECWLHPSRYRTEACKDGKHCKRKVCFFAHSPRQLRVLPPENVSGGACTSSSSPSLSPASVLGSGGNKSRCCLFCHSVSSSPTSTLLGLSHLSRSPSVSPPLSPANKAAAMSRLRTIGPLGGTVTYKDALIELMSSLESMSLTEALANSSSPATATAAGGSPTVANHPHLPWLDVDLNRDPQDLQIQQQPQSHLPCALSPVNSFGDGGGAAAAANENIFEDGYGDPDIGWVNDLLM